MIIIAVIDSLRVKKIKKEEKIYNPIITEIRLNDLKDLALFHAGAIDTYLGDNLYNIARAMLNIAPLPIGRYDVSEWDECVYL